MQCACCNRGKGACAGGAVARRGVAYLCSRLAGVLPAPSAKGKRGKECVGCDLVKLTTLALTTLAQSSALGAKLNVQGAAKKAGIRCSDHSGCFNYLHENDILLTWPGVGCSHRAQCEHARRTVRVLRRAHSLKV